MAYIRVVDDFSEWPTFKQNSDDARTSLQGIVQQTIDTTFYECRNYAGAR
jgi:hypothetical protein